MKVPSPPERLRLTAARIEEILATEEFIDHPSAGQLYRAGRVLGLWNGKQYVVPAFQFNRDTGELDSRLAQLVELLPKDASGSFDPGDTNW